jgi:hypothetical protein
MASAIPSVKLPLNKSPFVSIASSVTFFGREWSFGPRGLGGQLCFEPLRGLLWSGLLPDRSIRNGIHLFLDKLGRCVMIYAGGQCVFQFHSPG